MDEREQIIYMQVRVARMVAERRGITLADAARLLADGGGFRYIADNWGLFHLEGDEAVCDDVLVYVAREEGC